MLSIQERSGVVDVGVPGSNRMVGETVLYSQSTESSV